jgi:23S rRNA (guanosine2251-2'-O)-methyltransferase
MDGEPFYKSNLKGAIALVIGSEGNGVGRLVKEKCDVTLSMPMKGKINSLNASVAAGILMYEVSRQRD